MSRPSIVPIHDSELGEMAAALSEAGLLVDDIAEPARAFFRLVDGGTVGFGGLEVDGPDRLLRSLVILPSARGTGRGRTLLLLLEQAAREAGTHRLHLLTQTAAPFFRAHGYADADRDHAPPAIASTAEFATLCPASAVYLVKDLDPA